MAETTAQAYPGKSLPAGIFSVRSAGFPAPHPLLSPGMASYALRTLNACVRYPPYRAARLRKAPTTAFGQRRQNPWWFLCMGSVYPVHGSAPICFFQAGYLTFFSGYGIM